jgi:hypothetical protein
MDLYLHGGMFVGHHRARFSRRFKGSFMELFLQFGYGMMEHCRSLISDWGGGTVILSPRDLNGDQLQKLSDSITRIPNGYVMLDPQFYLPHSDHERLCSHNYWPSAYSTTAFFGGPPLTDLLSKLHRLNHSLRTCRFVLPGLLASQVNGDWLSTQQLILEEAQSLNTGLPLCQTIALSDDAGRSNAQIALLLEHAEKYPADAYYLVCEHPKGEYLVEDANWLANILDLTAGLRLLGAEVIIGYCNHQMLAAASAKATAVASGTWMNVRSFPPDKFRVSYDEEIKQRSVWYYAPRTLSEYKVPFLDIAHRVSLLGELAPPLEMQNSHSRTLFSGGQPSTVGITEQAAFRHYLTCLKIQTQQASLSTFDSTVTAHETILAEAEDLLARLSSPGIRGQKRDFTDIIDVNRAALAVLQSTRGAMLRRRWDTL